MVCGMVGADRMDVAGVAVPEFLRRWGSRLPGLPDGMVVSAWMVAQCQIL
jgi:hypothetical protein